MSFHLHELGRKFEQRAGSRIFIPGATVSWKLSGQKSFPETRFPLSDISIGGLAFLTNNPPDVRSEITILISLPQQTDAFELLGEVKYSITRGPRLTYKYRVGVELRPFEQANGCNSPQVLDQVKALEKKFGKRRSK
jgi:hypothetical protein